MEMSESSKCPRIISTADLHLGHNRVSSSDTIDDIRKYLFPQIPNVDMIVIIGDVFDGDVSFNSQYAPLIIGLFMDLLVECFKHEIVLRIVRGTFSHDNLMLRMFNSIIDKLGLPVDCKVINDMSIEHIKKYSIDVMYMPDNLPYKTKEEVLDNARLLLKVNNITSVKYVFVHGEFDHMIYGHISSNAYVVDDFKDICHGLILAGHIHKPHKHKNVIYSGSFNRLAHNEEEKKGFWIIDDLKATFIENKDSTKFITVDYRGEVQFDSVIKRHREVLKRFDEKRYGFLRVILADSNIKQALADFHNENYHNVKLTFKSPSRHDPADNEYLDEKLRKKNAEVLETPSAKNIASIVCKHLAKGGIIIDLSIVESIING